MLPEDLIDIPRPDGPAEAQPDRSPAGPGRFDFDSPKEASAPETFWELMRGQKLWLNALLLVLTFFTTTLIGAHMQYIFAHNVLFPDLSDLSLDELKRILTLGLGSPALFAAGLPFSLTLLTILMAHELGHFLACVYYGVDATLPFFLPSPVPVTGTFGAFIRIRSPIYTKRALFDIGIAGPLAGFLFLIPALGVGLAFSKVVPGADQSHSMQFGIPLLEWLARRLIFPGVPTQWIYLHPVARAAWVGMLATAMNLLPAGQLDGGHIIYGLMSRWHKRITFGVIIALLPLGWFSASWHWWGFAVLLFFLARKHPPVFDESEIGFARVRLGWLALLVFILCFTASPIRDIAG